MVENKAIENTYRNYLQMIDEIDLKKKSRFINCNYTESGILIPFFNNNYLLTAQGIDSVGNSPEPSFGIKVVLLQYVLVSESVLDPYDAPYVTYREFRDSAPLVSYFVNNTNKTIEHQFSGKTDLLHQRCTSLNGKKLHNKSYDLSYEFKPLPNVPVVLNFNDRDDTFPATCSLLFRKSAEKYLDMECLAMCGTFLTGMLLSGKH